MQWLFALCCGQLTFPASQDYSKLIKADNIRHECHNIFRDDI